MIRSKNNDDDDNGGGGSKIIENVGKMEIIQQQQQQRQQQQQQQNDIDDKQIKWIENLPKQPIPNLKLTLKRYINGLEPVIQNKLQMEQTKQIVKEFYGKNFDNDDDDNDDDELSEGKLLQKLLIEYSKQTDNWSTDFWLDDMYLTNSSSLLINSNPFFLLPKQIFNRYADFIRFASIFIRFTLKFYEQIITQKLKQDTLRGKQLLCMQTYKNFFTACRIPNENKDILFKNNDNLIIDDKKPKHFIVAAFNRFTVVYLLLKYDNNNNNKLILPEINELEECLLLIWQNSKQETTLQQQQQKRKSFDNIGILTTENRKIWSKIRLDLMKDEKNAENIHLIETSLFILCLDDNISLTNKLSNDENNNNNNNNKNCFHHRNSIQIAKMDQSFCSSMLLHGGGSDINTSNRWWDKFLQIIISKNGICGTIMEHSASEGITMLNFLGNFLKYYYDEQNMEYKKQHQPTSLEWQMPSDFSLLSLSPCDKTKIKTNTIIQKIQPLQWNIINNNNDIEINIKNAEKHANKLINDTNLFILNFNKFGTEFIKKQKLSPDAFIQLSLQLTYYKLHNQIVSTYESCSLRKYLNGRVDTIRSSTNETLDWVKCMCLKNNNNDNDNLLNIQEDQKIKLFKRAIQKQVEIMHYTSNGFGPENHLRALRELSIKNFNKIPSLFREKSFSEYGNYRLSTSQLPIDYDVLVGYGPVVNNGYGCSYIPKNNKIIFCITSFYSSNETSSDFFASSLESSLLQMQELCLQMNNSSTEFSARTPEPDTNVI